jgi:hypothetical protein
VSSGVHGVEGFCGSGIQINALSDPAVAAMAGQHGVAVLYIHALNPYGFSYVRRVTQENVDLNRNFPDFTKPLPSNVGYRGLHKLLLPEKWPGGLSNSMKLAWASRKLGARGFQAAVSAGQYEFKNGLFYGGREPTWSHQTLRKIVDQHCAAMHSIAWIDLHTGLGPAGHGERILCGRNNPQGLSDAQAIWGAEVKAFFDASTVSADVSGSMLDAVALQCKAARFNGMALEFGTLDLKTVLTTMRAEQWLQLHPRTGAKLAMRIKRQMLDAFFIDTEEWKENVVQLGKAALLQAIEHG